MYIYSVSLHRYNSSAPSFFKSNFIFNFTPVASLVFFTPIFDTFVATLMF